MSTDFREKEKRIFSLFSPTVRRYIYGEGWDSLREIQVQAAENIFFSSCDLLISSGTATGKTEAAFFPVLSQMENKPGSLILYISPVKALINDQFQRLGMVLRESDIPLCHWHGDVGANKKNAFLQDPRGVLQITPESLEGLLLRRWEEIPSLFGNLRYVIVDEIHALMASDRGNQVLCLLKRIETAIGHRPRRIGLSATLSHTHKASLWLSGGENEVQTVKASSKGQRFRIGIEHFTKEDDCQAFIYRATAKMKSIVFSNTREEAENITANLKNLAEKKGDSDRFYLHHASLPATIRKEAEEKLGSEEKEATVVATTTLEYGIDIEKLKRIICLQSPLSVSSFLQRMGRSGRRESPPEMLFALKEDFSESDSLFHRIPFELLQTIAIIELYTKEGFIEEEGVNKRCDSLLFHQTLSVLGAEGEKSAPQLAALILNLPPFRLYPKEDYKLLLIHMIKHGYLEMTEEKKLIVGSKGERMLSSYQFLSVFQNREQFSVYLKNEKIGNIASIPPIGESFLLGGKAWEVKETDLMKKAVFVQPGKNASANVFQGSGALIHTRILEKMKEILLGEQSFPYLLPGAKLRLDLARKEAQEVGLSQNQFLSLGNGDYVLFPFVGTKGFETVKRIFAKEIAPLSSITDLRSHAPYYLTFHCNEMKVKENIREILKSLKIEKLSLASPGEAPIYQKYDACLPRSLLLSSLEANRLEKEEALEKLLLIFQ